jgi:hypothetical protein
VRLPHSREPGLTLWNARNPALTQTSENAIGKGRPFLFVASTLLKFLLPATHHAEGHASYP